MMTTHKEEGSPLYWVEFTDSNVNLILKGPQTQKLINLVNLWTVKLTHKIKPLSKCVCVCVCVCVSVARLEEFPHPLAIACVYRILLVHKFLFFPTWKILLFILFQMHTEGLLSIKIWTFKGKKVIKIAISWGIWEAQLLEHLTSAQVIISWFMGLSPVLDSVLTAQSLEPAKDSVSPSLSAPPLLMLCSLSQK